MKTAAVVAMFTFLAGCGTASVVNDTAPAPQRSDPRATLTGRVSKAMDAAFTAEYEWSGGETVTVWAAEDGTWRVDLPGWGLGGEADVSVAWTAGGFFQCAQERCVKLAGITGEVPEAYDPLVQRPFVVWLPRLLERNLPFAVSREGDCFTLTANTVVVDTPIPEGEWCLDQHGTVLSVEAAGFGTLTLAGPVEPAAPTVELPGEVEDGDPVEREAPETPEAPDPSGGPSEEPSDTEEAGRAE